MMSSLEGSDLWYEAIVEKVFDAVPEAFEVYDRTDEPYMVMFEFGSFLRDNLANQIVAAKCFDFIELSLNEGQEKTEAVVVLQVFQLLFEDLHNSDAARRYMNGKSAVVFEESIRAWNEFEPPTEWSSKSWRREHGLLPRDRRD